MTTTDDEIKKAINALWSAYARSRDSDRKESIEATIQDLKAMIEGPLIARRAASDTRALR